jgi:heme exporter protein D
MGGYAAFVWPAFGVAAVTLVVLYVVSWRGLKAREAELDSLPPLPARGARSRLPTGAKPASTRVAS